MNPHEQETPEQYPSGPSDATPAPAWQTPAYTVVETSLEVTAYRLADR
ncbi:hypothetical protein GCM10018785_35180 [Streptomyces longispororuber]|uniref:Coenzyme PQQ synthesis protein A n=1 Tax=Streptomyces longispororuber TaxID=68230 RepID=A0A918ZP71_9ACTN|nr:pyrroloquinoline quinone precursor peptide PqqA [Streptomyces longispororuber]GHE63230.1 hypothetical protein GCM10018785_35180 [Streptomyces longispororuber]